MLPVIGRRDGAGIAIEVESRFLQPDAVYTPSGAAAILFALRCAAVGAGDQVLVPAYHCPTMVWPVQLAGATPIFVPMRDDLVIGVQQLRALRGERVRALLVPHYFALAQPELGEIRRWCDQHGIVLVEDCAHMFYGGREGHLPGATGHFAIASTRKFFAGTEGGAIVANAGELRHSLARASLRDELRDVLGTIRFAREYGALPRRARRVALRSTRLEGARDAQSAAREALPAATSPAELRSARCERQATRLTQWLLRREPHAIAAAIRRARWMRWRELIDCVEDVDPFDDSLPAHTVPYVFAARLRDPLRQFAALKYAGVQVWRWDRLAVSDCATSRRLGLELIQLPCQQSLPDERFEQLVQGFRDALATGAGGARGSEGAVLR